MKVIIKLLSGGRYRLPADIDSTLIFDFDSALLLCGDEGVLLYEVEDDGSLLPSSCYHYIGRHRLYVHPSGCWNRLVAYFKISYHGRLGK